MAQIVSIDYIFSSFSTASLSEDEVLKNKIKSAAIELAAMKAEYMTAGNCDDSTSVNSTSPIKTTKDLMEAQWKLLRTYNDIDKEKASQLLKTYNSNASPSYPK